MQQVGVDPRQAEDFPAVRLMGPSGLRDATDAASGERRGTFLERVGRALPRPRGQLAGVLLTAQAAAAAGVTADSVWLHVAHGRDLAADAPSVLAGIAVFVISVIASVALMKVARRLLEALSENAVLRTEVATDGLTGLGSRRSFDAAMTAAWVSVIRARAPVSLILIDIDQFKPFNDTYGHVEGDRVLRAAADSVKSALGGTSGRAFRFGGEEFAVLLVGVGLVEAARVAAVIQGSVEALRWPHSGGERGVVTVSLGVAEAVPSQAPMPPEQLIEAADRALYSAKQEGRAQLRVAAVVRNRSGDALADEMVDGVDIVLRNGSVLKINTRLRIQTLKQILATVSGDNGDPA